MERTTPRDLDDHWRDCYAAEPRAHELRAAHADRWLRIHALPDAKRYPESPAEHATVLHRHNEVLAALLSPGDAVLLITTGDSAAQEPRPVQGPHLSHPDAWHWRTIPGDPDD